MAAPAGSGTGRPARPTPPRRRPQPVPPRRFTWRVAVFVVALLAVVGAAVSAVAWYARSTYYVGLDGDQVAIFKGRPGGLLWFEPTLEERKRPTGADVLPAARELDAGHEEPTKADADRYVNNLRQEAARRAAPPRCHPAIHHRAAPTTTSTSRP